MADEIKVEKVETEPKKKKAKFRTPVKKTEGGILLRTPVEFVEKDEKKEPDGSIRKYLVGALIGAGVALGGEAIMEAKWEISPDQLVPGCRDGEVFHEGAGPILEVEPIEASTSKEEAGA